MSESTVEHFRQHVKVYISVGIVLLFLTVVTVAVSAFDFDVGTAITIGLLIAMFKGSLVALFFMHLTNEQRLIYGTLILTVFFFFALLLLPYFSQLDTYGEAPIYVP